MGNFIGGIAGDIIGSVYEWHNAKGMDDIELFRNGVRFTDDTVLTCAVADWLMNDENHTSEGLANRLRSFASTYPYAGYGGKFMKWFKGDSMEPIGSFGNGSGMRVSSVGYYAKSLEEAMSLAKASAEVTHNHPEGIKGAQAIAVAVFMAVDGYGKEAIKEEIEKRFGYDLNKHVADYVELDSEENVVSRAHKFDATCQVTVPEAIVAFLESTDYESAIELAIIIGGDSDTIADMAGAIAGAYYGVPQWIGNMAMSLLPEDLFMTVRDFETFATNRRYEK
ncbi:MAG: ADP-ribosylglycohydrolase family protein [Paludibacteraceae bacterium]|nr:ADP-ribosylglycohydrolase family protein [Paludibacteraceae bacterium]